VAALITPPLTPIPTRAEADERRRQRIEVLVVLDGARAHEQHGLVAPLMIEDVDARIDRRERAGLFEIAAHFVVQMRVRAPAGRADRGDELTLLHGLAGVHFDRVAVAVDRDEAIGVLDGDDIAEAPPGTLWRIG
jgi:predicted NAD/FAD-binding protein